MKKSVIAAAVVLSIFFACSGFCAADSADQKGAAKGKTSGTEGEAGVKGGQKDKSADQPAAENNEPGIFDNFMDPIVYVSKSDKKYYHTKDCELLKDDFSQKKVSEIKRKYKPCPKCKPPQ